MIIVVRPLFIARILIALVVVAVCASAQQSVMSEDRVLGFVDYLEQLGEYRRAANELQRLIVSDRPAADSLTMRAGSLYIRGEAPELAELVVRRRLSAPTQNTVQLRYLLAHALYRQRRYPDAATELNGIVIADSSERSYSASLFLSLCSAEQQSWDAARSDLQRAGAYAVTDEQKTALMALGTVIDESSAIPQKSPFVAGLLSGIVPGLGKVYTGHTVDGVLSFLTIASFGYAAYDGFASDGSSSARGWIFGSLATGLYLGNIYGSALSASIVRDEATRQLQMRLRTAFSIAGVP